MYSIGRALTFPFKIPYLFRIESSPDRRRERDRLIRKKNMPILFLIQIYYFGV